MINTIIINGLSFALPLFIMAVGGIYSEKSGVTMLCIEGFQGFGAFCGAFAVIIAQQSIGASSPWLIYIALAAAILGGMLFSVIHAVLCIFLRANQVISGVVVNILASAVTIFATSIINEVIFNKPSNLFNIGVSQKYTVPGISQIPVIGALFKDVYPYEIIILIVACIMSYLMYKTKFGLRLRACGENPQSVDAAGGSVTKVRFISVIICGGLSGIGGMFFAYSMAGNFSASIYSGYGYLAIAALIFGNWDIWKTLAVCLFFGIARAGGYQLCLVMGLSSNYSFLFQTIPYILTLVLLVFFSKYNHPPKATGEFFDKGKR
ncbi:ABC transporter permease [Frisingicoccus sp.]|uniref:ABC transporter permease n=1 Tax=Frisingicoccus sp. TaxID=1918627 RepID=UPI003AB7476C